MNKERTISLSKNLHIPLVGFGTYLISNDDAAQAVSNAIESGYRHVDTAEAYRNEQGVGMGIQSGLGKTGLSRDQLFITTKLWPGNAQWGDTPKTFDTTITSLNASLGRLQLEYVDLYLIHATFDPGQRLEQWKGLVELKRQGKARAIGVSNFSEQHIEELRSAGLPLPAANQIELHPWSQKPQLIRYLRKNGIVPIAYSSLVPLSTWRAAKGQDSAKTEQMQKDSQDADSPFKKMAQKYGVSEAQVLLRWGVQNGYPVLPKSMNSARLKENIDLFSFSIDEEDMATIEKMDRGDGVAWAFGDPTRNA
ncbi:MAG: aldo/keto reductase [Lewinellaceae bacterium]|nr:aldo/keto reductase [Lewinellaceae bacterium]